MIGDFPNLVSNHIGLVFSAITCTVAAFYTVWGAAYGMVAHRIPRMLLGAAVAVIALSYWTDVFDWWSGADMRRGAGWLMWPSLAWTAWSGIRYKRRIDANIEATFELVVEEGDV